MAYRLVRFIKIGNSNRVISEGQLHQDSYDALREMAREMIANPAKGLHWRVEHDDSDKPIAYGDGDTNGGEVRYLTKDDYGYTHSESVAKLIARIRITNYCRRKYGSMQEDV
jgi:hypothetical protein